jgi:hypothetical protein
MNWKPHTEHPKHAPQAVLIAVADGEGGYLLLSDLHLWNGSSFVSEETGKPNTQAEFWWLSEIDVLEGLPA